MTEARRPRRASAGGALETGKRLRVARLSTGMTQRQLAEACGISRQAVAGTEAGTWFPSLGVALRLARALGTSVDQLFAAEQEPLRARATALGESRPPDRARMALVWDRWVALPLAGDRAMVAGFRGASGRLGRNHDAEIWGTGRTLVVAGCDPALPLLAEPVAAAHAGWTVEWWSCSSGEALRLLDQGLVHAAAVHRPSGHEEDSGRPTLSARIGFSGWREGVLLPREGAAGGARSLGEVVDRRLRWVNRELGSEARSLLDRELGVLGVAGAILPGYSSQAGGHFQVAGAVASGIAQAAIATEPAALAYGLRFLPLTEEESVLHVRRDRLDTPELRLLLGVMAGPSLSRELSALPGYDTSILGRVLS